MTLTNEERKLIRNLLVDYKNQLLRERLKPHEIIIEEEIIIRQLLEKFRKEE